MIFLDTVMNPAIITYMRWQCGFPWYDKCPANQYSTTFKKQCPQAYSYAYDDKTSTFTCPSGGNYLIAFCP